MEKVVPNSKFVGHSTEIIQQSKIKGPLLKKFEGSKPLLAPCEFSRDLAKDHVCLFVMFLYVMRTWRRSLKNTHT